jgi:hypothetical protein
VELESTGPFACCVVNVVGHSMNALQYSSTVCTSYAYVSFMTRSLGWSVFVDPYRILGKAKKKKGGGGGVKK